MAINIQIGQTDKKEEKKESNIKTKLQIRKSVNGSIIIADHEDVDIVIMPEKNKIVTFSTDQKNSDKKYATADRLFKYLAKKGMIEYDSVHSSNVYGSMEAKLQQSSEGINVIDLLILVLDKWIEEEKPSFIYTKEYEEAWEKELTEPEDEDTTGLGAVPHEKTRHNIDSSNSFPTSWKP